MIRMESHAVALKTLELFDAKAEEFLSSRFFNETRGGGAIAEKVSGSEWESIFVGPHEESTKALVLTLRLFKQKNDRISLAKMEELYGSLALSAQVTDEFASRCSELDTFLDSSSGLAIEEGRPMTYLEIMDLFLYGAYAHVNPDKRQVYEDIRTTPFFVHFQNRFGQAVTAYGRCVWALRQVNQRAIHELGPA